MLTKLLLKAGSSANQPPLAIDLPPSMTIFVGPNNSGKSQALREISTYCQNGQHNPGNLIFDKLVFASENEEEVQASFKSLKIAANPDQVIPFGNSLIKWISDPLLVHDNTYLNARISPNEYSSHYTEWHLKRFVLNLNGSNRTALLDHQLRGDLKYPSTPFAKLLTNDVKRNQLRNTIYDSVRLYFALDASQGNEIHVRFGETPPPDERNYNDDVLEYMRKARSMYEVSDGIKAYTGILAQVYIADPKVIIIDEPEAFLHPSLAQKLGKELANGAILENKHIFVSTHSSNFIIGAILSGAKINIIRLTFENNIGTARLLSSTDLTILMQDPMLRSVGVLSGLFYNNVIVCEADADRAFYQEINERLLAKNDPRGIQHALFLNTNGKDTISKVIEPLRKLGIPAAAIVDIDIFKIGGQDWTRNLKACNFPATEYQPYGTRRASVLSALTSANSEYKTKGGVAVLSLSQQEAANNLCDDLARYGFFVVRRGEVEAWLSLLDISRSKHSWLYSIFEKMGNNPQSETYVLPDIGDVWDFIGEIKTWLADSGRKGIPA